MARFRATISRKHGCCPEPRATPDKSLTVLNLFKADLTEPYIVTNTHPMNVCTFFSLSLSFVIVVAAELCFWIHLFTLCWLCTVSTYMSLWFTEIKHTGASSFKVHYLIPTSIVHFKLYSDLGDDAVCDGRSICKHARQLVGVYRVKCRRCQSKNGNMRGLSCLKWYVRSFY